MASTARQAPGRIALLGSGETTAAGGRVFEALARELPRPLNAAVLETPAGFQPNSAGVAAEVADYLGRRLQNYRPQVAVIPARQRGTPLSPDDSSLAQLLLDRDLIFMGPGSPTYAVRQLQGSLLWETLLARHRLGASLAFASAATIAVGAFALPVYEIYKAGHDLHWHPGLDLFGPYGLSLALVPHWNNTEGGAGLDTSCGFMGRERFDRLLALLPPHVTVVGIDEQTGLLVDLEEGTCRVLGRGGVTLLRDGAERLLGRRERFPLGVIGPFRRPAASEGLAAPVWERAKAAWEEAQVSPSAPRPVLALVEQRQAARERHDWATADALRRRIVELGWEVRDTRSGPHLAPLRDTAAPHSQ